MVSIKDRNTIDELEVLGVKITEIRRREVHGLCPSHPDSHPSFFFNLDTQFFHCFGCSLKGRGINKLRYRVTGILVNKEDSPKIHKVETQNIKSLPSILSCPSAIGTIGEDYLKTRGFNSETIREWDIMYSSFKKVIIIPLGKIGYVERYLEPQKNHKKYHYAFNSSIVCDLFGSSKFDKNSLNAVIVEGSLDAIWLHQLGFKNALALMHADISPQQIRVLQGITSIVYTLLDNDRGGIEATEKITKKLKEKGFIVKNCMLPNGKDPNDCTKEEIEKALKGEKF
jgi:DNA primase